MSNKNTFSLFVEQQLNTIQQEAIQKTKGPLLVIAGAGSGKTRVITARITHLILNEKVNPTTILALTFTNKAASEMKERILSFLQNGQEIPFVGTFHAYCLSLLKRHYNTPFSILDSDDKQTMLTTLLKKSVLYKKYTPQQITHAISMAKNTYSSSTQTLYTHFDNQALKDLVAAYEHEKKISNCFDFDDLLIEAVRLFENAEFREKHQKTITHILVDEYQDTNHVQHALLKKMALSSHGDYVVQSLCAVGDEDQSIYSWRGATVDNIMHFKNDFKQTTVIKMEQNYRSKQSILHVANEIIEHNRYRNAKKLWSDRTGTDCVRMIRCLSGYQEADIIARFCTLISKHKPNESVGILYRTHFQSRALEEALIKHSLAYTLVGGIRFYERKEIKDILAYLRLIVNPHDRVAFIRAVNCPTRGLGEKCIEHFLNAWNIKPDAPFMTIAQTVLDDHTITGVKAEQLQSFINLFTPFTAQSQATKAIEFLLHSIHYQDYLEKNYEKEEARERQANIKEFLNAAHYFATQGKTTLHSLLNEVALLQEQSDKNDKNKAPSLYLMTLHAAKGLEFDTVIIAGLEETLFPSSRATQDPRQLEEERRLFYVGITRARNALLLTLAQYRQTYGQMDAVAPSRFSFEIPPSLCKTDNASSWRTHDSTTYFSQWLKISPSTPENNYQVFTPITFKAERSSIVTPPENQPLPAISSSLPQAHTQTKVITEASKTSPSFKKHQTIKHETFGIGIIKDIEERSSNTIITAQFKQGIKKIDAKFLQNL